MSNPITLEMIYKEVKQVNVRLRHIEDAVEEVIIKELPEVKISDKERKQIKQSIEDIEKGECVALEELKSAADKTAR